MSANSTESPGYDEDTYSYLIFQIIACVRLRVDGCTINAQTVWMLLSVCVCSLETAFAADAVNSVRNSRSYFRFVFDIVPEIDYNKYMSSFLPTTVISLCIFASLSVLIN